MPKIDLSIHNIHTSVSPLGKISISSSASGLTHLKFGDEVNTSTIISSKNPVWLEEALNQVLEFLEGKREIFEVPIDWSIFTPFQKLILQRCFDIPYGKLVTYAELGEIAGKPKASRAIGGVMARNPLPLIIPCHRVIAANRKLHGYSGAGGLQTKAWLLELEGHKIVNQRLD